MAEEEKRKIIYLKDYDRVFAECYLWYDAKKKRFFLQSMENGWYDGEEIEWDEKGKPYITKTMGG